jgi:predicted TIM-barrel fold metal-dependent hydrolase
MMIARGLFLASAILTPVGALAQDRIIDMHQHAGSATFWGTPDPEWFQHVPPRAESDEQLISATLGEMDRFNIVKAVFSGPVDWVDRWQSVAPERILRGSNFGSRCHETRLSQLRELHGVRGYEVMGEISWQWSGISPDDPGVEACFALAEELDVPMGIHLGLGYPGASSWSGYRADAGRPLLLEPMLKEHPNVRVYVMHAGWPMIDETIALMHSHQQVYADLSLINWFIPREAFHDTLRRLTDAGLGDRLMYGSDAGVWPGAIEASIESIRAASFLSEDQREAIFYGNASRFLRLGSDR